MKLTTRIFGEVEIDDSKIISFPNGIIGFPDLKKFTLIYDEEKGDDHDTIMWFQSIDEPQFALPVVLPIIIKPDYNPTINDELLLPLGELTEENTYVLVTIKVPTDPTQMSVNLKAPIIINTDTLRGGQLIVEDDYEVRFPIYDILKKAKEEAGE